MRASTASAASTADHSDPAAWARFARTILLVLAGMLAASAVLTILVLWRAGEFMSVADRVAYQKRTGALYRSASRDDIMDPAFRFAIYDLEKPSIVAIGSSRVLQFRADEFTKPFTNMGMSFAITLLPRWAALMTGPGHRLEHVIVGIDHWQIAPYGRRLPSLSNWTPSGSESGFARRARRTAWHGLAFIKATLGLFATGRVSFLDAAQILCRCGPNGAGPDLGIAAIIDGSGIDAAGSYYYDWVHESGVARPPFHDTLGRVKAGNQGFERHDAADPRILGLIREAVTLFREQGVATTLFVPPMAPRVADAMRASGGYAFLQQAVDTLRKDGLRVHDFHDIRNLGGSDCEFADGMHGGEVAYMRMLRYMAADDPAGLGSLVDRARLDDLIARHAGRANAADAPRRGDKSRTRQDYWNLGCGATP